MENGKMYQVSTLQALALGYTRAVIKVKELLEHGDTGLGTFEAVDGEMIAIGGHCYRAMSDGSVVEADPELGVPFSSVTKLEGRRKFELADVSSIDELKGILNNKIEEDFGLNSMNVVRIDGKFGEVEARSEMPFESQHVELKDILGITQKSFDFKDVEGSVVCVYYPDYMDGINAPGWHLHFVSEDRRLGGHVFGLKLESASAKLDKITNIDIQLPTEPAFDTYALKEASGSDIKKVEQGDK